MQRCFAGPTGEQAADHRIQRFSGLVEELETQGTQMLQSNSVRHYICSDNNSRRFLPFSR